MGHSGSYLIGESSGDHTMSSTASASMSQLPARHPLLMHQEVPQEHTTPLGFAAHREATSAASTSQSLPVLDHSENTIPQSSSALAQLLSTSSAHDVLRLNRSGLSGTHTATTTGGQDVGHTDTEDPGNQTSIPSTYSRWSEECEALDGSIQHLCINCIKPSIITSLEQTYDKENKRKAEEKEDDKGRSSTATTDSTATTSSLERAVRNRIATAAANVNSAIDNLHASLQSVASSLAGTVEMVRSGLSSPAVVTSTPSNRGNTDQDRSEEQEDDRNELPLPSATEESTTQPSSAEPPPLLVPFTETQPTSNTTTSTSDTLTTPTVQSSSATLTLQPLPMPTLQSSATPTVQPSDTPIAPPSVTSVPPLATPTVPFDGSQASAAAMLQNTDPTDPMYMFLSAVAGAPAPPLPESSSAATTAPPTQELSEDEVRQRRATSDALRIASRIAEMFQSDALPLPGDDDDDDDEDDEDDEEVTGVITQSNIATSSLASSLAASLVQSLTTGNSTSPCTTLAPQLSDSLQVQQAVNESSQSGQSEMVGDIIPLVPNQRSATTTATAARNNTASGGATTNVLSLMPEELDSTFLEALPESIREELVSQHAAEMRRRQMQSQAGSSGDNFVSTISPEFLAALPPSIQEEVS